MAKTTRSKNNQSKIKYRNILVTGGAGFIGSHLALELQIQYPQAYIVVVDDFRSGAFKNLEGFYGDVVAEDVSRVDFRKVFSKRKFDAAFHLASVTDTTNYDQKYQVFDNVEGFRNLLDYLKPMKPNLVYASSAATYGIVSGSNREDDPKKPANVYAFSKVILDNLAKIYACENTGWKINGVRYFNVYGPKESHKGVPASMIWHLYLQMKAGKNPRIFKHGEQLRDFIYVKDAVQNTVLALSAPTSGKIYNTGSGTARTFNDVIASLNKTLRLNLKAEYFENPYPHYQNHTEADLSLSKKELGFKPNYTLEDGIEEYVQWITNNLS